MPRHKQLVNVNSKKDIEKTIQKNSGMKLTVKQEMFATEYARNNGNGLQAATFAGYSGTDNYFSMQA